MTPLVRILFPVALLWNGHAHSLAKSQPAKDLVSPKMTQETPAPGKRVRQIAHEYKGTQVYHSLYLPTDWQKGKTYPVLVEYTGNKFPACGSTGEVKGANLGYGLSGGRWIHLGLHALCSKRKKREHSDLVGRPQSHYRVL